MAIPFHQQQRSSAPGSGLGRTLGREDGVTYRTAATTPVGHAPPQLTREVFKQRFMQSYFDPAYRAEDAALARLEEIAWSAYQEGRKAPVTQPAGPGFADPSYELSVEWRAARDKLIEAAQDWGKPETKSRVLLVCGSSRNDGTCPGEIS